MNKLIRIIMVVFILFNLSSCLNSEKPVTQNQSNTSTQSYGHYESGAAKWIWKYSLQNNYAIISERAPASEESAVVIARFENSSIIEFITIVVNIQQYCYNDRYICTMGQPDTMVIGIDPNNSMGFSQIPNDEQTPYYIVDTKNQEKYGPFYTFEVFSQQCIKLNVGVLCDWIQDEPPEEAIYN